MPREELVARTLVQLADTTVDDFNVIDLLTLLCDRCVEVFGVPAATIIVAAVDGDLEIITSTHERARIAGLLAIPCEEWPCFNVVRTGKPFVNQGLKSAGVQFPRFSAVCLKAGFTSLHAVPMSLRGTMIGALNLFTTAPVTMSDEDVNAAQAFADVATIAIIQHRAQLSAGHLIGDLRRALVSRIVLEQAKGRIAEQAHTDIASAFELLRKYARDHNLRLDDLAQRVADGSLGSNQLKARPPPKGRTQSGRGFGD